MSELCTDNRFELIEKYKQKLIDATNIETAPDEMAVIDNILFRFWQMRWLDKLDADAVPVVRCKDCIYYIPSLFDGFNVCSYAITNRYVRQPDDYCSRGERKENV